MGAPAYPPVVRLQLSCSDCLEYERSFAPRFAAKGVFVTTERLRPIGAAVQLRIELLDQTVVFAGMAVVESHSSEGQRTGYVLRTGERGEAGRPSAPPPVVLPPERAATSRPGRSGPAVSLAAPLFSETGALADEDRAAAAPAAAPAPPDLWDSPVEFVRLKDMMVEE